jgi:hypothetical protein
VLGCPGLRLARRARQDFKLVTPGIRPAGAGHDDQARIITPEAAVANSRDFLVIRRPITQAADPLAALAAITPRWESRLSHGHWRGLRWPCHRRLSRGVGNDVLCVDIDAASRRSMPVASIHEPGLEALIKRNEEAGRLRFTTDAEAAVAHGAPSSSPSARRRR